MEKKQEKLDIDLVCAEETIKWSEGFEKVKLPDGVYPARIMGIDNFQAKYGTCKRIIFEIPHKKELYEMAYACYPGATIKSKMGKVLLALGFEEGKNTKVVDMIGKTCQVFIKQEKINEEMRSVISDVIKK